MNVRTMLGRSPKPDVDIDELRERRIAVARASPIWTEIEADLVARGPYRVSASDDAVYTPFCARVFDTGSATTINRRVPLSFAVAGDELTFYERQPGTWSDIVRRRARSGAAT